MTGPMKKIFLAPRSNETAYKNYISSMQGRPREEVVPHLSSEDARKLGSDERFFIWGCQPSLKSRWDKLELGDYVMFYARGKFISVGELIFKTVNEKLAQSLWPINKDTNEPWSCLFFVDNIKEISVSLADFNEMTGYRLNQVQGFMHVTGAMEQIIKRYGDTDNFIQSLQSGFVKEEIAELIQLSEISPRNITKEEVARFDELNRGKDIEKVMLALKQHAIDALHRTPKRVAKTVYAYERNASLVRDMKAKHGDKCQICGFTFRKASGGYYSEAAHVIPISSGKQGVDSPDNIWILCANHHKMLDLHAIDAVSMNEYIEDGKRKKLLA
jgi:hypothetical protein